jgi:hypothetical protein
MASLAVDNLMINHVRLHTTAAKLLAGGYTHQISREIIQSECNGPRVDHHDTIGRMDKYIIDGWISRIFFYLFNRNIECNYYFHGGPLDRILISFTYFDVEGVYP